MTGEYLTVAEAAEFLKRHPETVRGYIRRGELAATRIGKRGAYLIPRHVLDRTLNDHAARYGRRFLSWSSRRRWGLVP